MAAMATAAALVLAGCGSDAEPTEDNTASPAASMTDEAAGDMAEMPGANAKAGSLVIAGVWVRESSLDMSGGFGTITNKGDTDDALVAATAVGVPEVQLHETVDGVM